MLSGAVNLLCCQAIPLFVPLIQVSDPESASLFSGSVSSRADLETGWAAITHETGTFDEVVAQLHDHVVLVPQDIRDPAGNPPGSRRVSEFGSVSACRLRADGERSGGGKAAAGTNFFMTWRLTFCMSTF